MRALVYSPEVGLELREVPEPRICHPDEVLLEVLATGICGTDIHILMGHYPARAGVVLGHETTGVVLAVGEGVRHVRPGDRVILDPTYHCGICRFCQTDRPNFCAEKATTETGVSRDGTFAERHVARAAFVHPLPPDLAPEVGTLTEPLACCLHGLRQTRLRPESRVLVVGAGPIGLLFALAVRSAGAPVTLADVAPYRVEQARLLFDEVLDLREAELAARFDLIVDTSGRMLDRLLPRVERGGEILLAGLDYSYEATIRPSQLTDNGVRLIGSIDTNRSFAAAISLLRRVPEFARVVTHRLPLAEFGAGFAALGVDLRGRERREIGANKVVLRPREDP